MLSLLTSMLSVETSNLVAKYGKICLKVSTSIFRNSFDGENYL